MGGNNNGQRTILSVNGFRGHLNWEWSDLLTLFEDPSYKDPIHLVYNTYHRNHDKLFFTYATSSYCVNLHDGQTFWKYKTVRSRSSNNAGFGDTYFTSGATYGPLGGQKLFIGDLNSSSEDQVLITPDYTSVPNPHVNAQGVLTGMRSFKKGNDTHVAFGIENPSVDVSVGSWGPRDWGSTELNPGTALNIKTETNNLLPAFPKVPEH